MLFEITTGYLILINFLGALLCASDKHRAKKGLWRIPEKTLFLISILGGSVGVYFAMNAFRHKTKHLRFTVGIPLIIILQAALIISLLSLTNK